MCKTDAATHVETLQSRVFNTKHGSLPVSEYDRFFNGLWIELDQYQNLKMYKTDTATHFETLERGEVIQCEP